MTTPTGLPAWTRTAEASVYGGHDDKRDFMGQGVVNPQTDISAAEFRRLAADLAAVARTAPFAVVYLTCDDTTPADPTVNRVRQMTGVTSTSYAGASPPTGMPTVTREGDGDVTLEWEASYSDDAGVSSDINIRFAMANVAEDGDYTATVELVDERTVRVRAFELPSGDPAEDVEIVVEVYT